MPGMTNEQMIAVLMTVFVPLLISVALRPTWSGRVRAVVAFGLTLLVLSVAQLALIAAADVPSTWQSWLQFVLWGVVTVCVSYERIWRPMGVVQAVEAATSPTRTITERRAKARLGAEAARKATPPRDQEG